MNAGARREGPLNFAQQMFWLGDVHSKSECRWSNNVLQIFDLPEGTSTSGLVEALNALVKRHEALRTSYRSDRPVQVVHEPRPVEPRWMDVASPADAAELAARTRDGLAAHEFQLDREPPLQAVAITVAGVPAKLILGSHHLAVDGIGMEVLRGELGALLAGPAAAPPPSGQLAWQPLDQAAHEQSPQGQAANLEAQRYWESHFPELPGRLFPSARIGADAQAYEVVLESPGMTEAIAELGARHQGVGPVLLAAFGSTLLLTTGRERCSFLVASANRFAARQSSMVGCLIQLVPTTATLGGDPSFADLVDEMRSSALTAYWHGQFDFIEMKRREQEYAAARAVRPAAPPSFNFHDYGGAQVGTPRSRPTRLYVGPIAHGTRVRDLFMFNIYPGEQVVRLVLNCGAATPTEDATRFVQGFERLLIEAASDPGLRMADVGSRCGIEPPAPGSGWALVDNSWVEIQPVGDSLASSTSAPGGRPAHRRRGD